MIRSKKYKIIHRWEINNIPTSWATYRVFRTREKRDKYFNKLIENAQNSFIQYKTYQD